MKSLNYLMDHILIKIRNKNGTEITLKLSSNVVGDSNDENNFRHKLLLTNTQVSKLRKAFANNSSASSGNVCYLAHFSKKSLP